MPAGLVLAVILVLAPSAAQAAPSSPATIGPASFQRATGGAFSAPMHADGLKVYSASPAHIVLRSTGATGAIERFAAIHNFSWVAVPDPTPGHRGTTCFRNGHLVTLPSLVDNFVEGQVSYQGLFFQYSSSYFRRGDLNPRHCGLLRSATTVVPTISLSQTHATLRLDCMIGTCRGSLAVFRAAGACANPTTVLPSIRGCRPSLHGSFFMPGGRAVALKIPVPLFSLRFPAMQLAITVNRKLQIRSPLHSVGPVQRLPARPRRAAITARCGAGGSVGSSVAVTGSLTPGGARALVALTFTGPTGVATTTTVTSAPTGAYATRFLPRAAGNWTAQASFIGDRGRTAASSRSCSFVVSGLGPLSHVPPPG